MPVVETIGINVDGTSSDAPGQKVSDEALRALLNQVDDGAGGLPSGGSNISIVQIPKKQLVTIVPKNNTNRNLISQAIRQMVLSDKPADVRYSNVPDINADGVVRNVSSVLVTNDAVIDGFLGC